jgi:hypothetical protein
MPEGSERLEELLPLLRRLTAEELTLLQQWVAWLLHSVQEREQWPP